MKLLFVDHVCHQKTHSVDFLLEIFRKSFDVAECWYERHYRTGAERAVSDRDAAVIVEFPISRRSFFVPGKRNVFIPMYDNEWASVWQWRRIAWSGMGVISFSDAVTRHARRCGVTNILDVRFFPDPSALPQAAGDPKKVFLWERGAVTRQMAERLFPPSEGYSFVVKGAQDFWPRADYLARLAACGIVIAPRRKEGIGMAFLEAMAMGKCVAAHDDATMNEYIADGENGILFDADDPQPVSADKLRRVLEFCRGEAGRRDRRDRAARWQSDAGKLNEFVARQSVCRPSAVGRLKLALSYPLYLAEGLCRR